MTHSELLVILFGWSIISVPLALVAGTILGYRADADAHVVDTPVAAEQVRSH